jgi:hypothetical protein
MKGQSFPYIDEKLIDALVVIFPDTLPIHAKDPQLVDIYRLMGSQDVIQFLRNQLLKQQGV